MDRTEEHLGSWRVRRKYMFWNTAFNMAVIVYCLYKGSVDVKFADTKLADTAVTMASLALFGTLGSYVFGAVWDDSNKMKGRPRENKPVVGPRPKSDKEEEC